MNVLRKLTTIEIIILIPCFIFISAFFSTIGIQKITSLEVWVVVFIVLTIDISKFVATGLVVITKNKLLKILLSIIISICVILTSFSFYSALVFSFSDSEFAKRQTIENEAVLEEESLDRQLERYKSLVNEIDKSIEKLQQAKTNEGIYQERLRKREIDNLLSRKENYILKIDSLENQKIQKITVQKQKNELFLLNKISPNFYFLLLTLVFDPLAVLMYASFINYIKKGKKEERKEEIVVRAKPKNI